jgi:hypothetical protein
LGRAPLRASEAKRGLGSVTMLLAGLAFVLLLLTTVLPPIMRKLGRTESAPSGERLAHELLTAADRIEAVNAGNAGGPEIGRECERLRELARQYTR